MRVSANFYYLLTSSTVCLNPVSAWVGGGRIFERMQRGNVHMSTLVEKEVATIKDVKVMTKLTKNIKQADVGAAVPPYHRLLRSHRCVDRLLLIIIHENVALFSPCRLTMLLSSTHARTPFFLHSD